MPTKHVLLSVFSFLFLIFIPTTGLSIEINVEHALLKENWQQVATLIQQDTTQIADPVAVLLVGHANLATNRNNESLVLFLSVKEERELQQWASWTNGFLQKNANSHVAQYLAADAKGRLGKFEEAIASFSKLLDTQSDFALARNARGVLYALQNQIDLALVDFYVTTKSNPNLADAFANLGTLAVVQEASISQGDEALKNFTRALELNPDFSLAYNGKGCLYFGDGEFEKAWENFEKAKEVMPNLALPEINQVFNANYSHHLVTLASLGKTEGMYIKNVFEQHRVEVKREETALYTKIADPNFKNGIDSFAHFTPEAKKNFVEKYGVKTVVAAMDLSIKNKTHEAIRINQQAKLRPQKIKSANTGFLWMNGAYEILSKISAFSDARTIQKHGLNLTNDEVRKTLGDQAVNVIPSKNLKIANDFSDIIYKGSKGDVVGLGAFAVSKFAEAGRSIFDDKRKSQITMGKDDLTRVINLNTAVTQLRHARNTIYSPNTKSSPNHSLPTMSQNPSHSYPKSTDFSSKPLPRNKIGTTGSEYLGHVLKTPRSALYPTGRTPGPLFPANIPKVSGVYTVDPKTFMDLGDRPVMTVFGLFYTRNLNIVAKQ
ncbi:tetratricopeptide repeat protein [Nitrospira sp. Ecomares 2.1]